MLKENQSRKVYHIWCDGRAMGVGGTAPSPSQIDPTRRAPARGRPPRSPQHHSVSPSERVSMGYAAPRSPSQKHRLWLFCAMAWRRHLDDSRHSVTRTNPRGCGPWANPERSLHRYNWLRVL